MHPGRLATRKRGWRIDGSAQAEGEAPHLTAPRHVRGRAKASYWSVLRKRRDSESRPKSAARGSVVRGPGAWSAARGRAARGRAAGALTPPTGARASPAEPQFPHFAGSEHTPHGVPGALPRSPVPGLGGGGGVSAIGTGRRGFGPRRCVTDPHIPRAPTPAGMFVLVEMVDTVRIPPWQFERKLNDSIAEELNKKLANKVLGRRGR